MFKIESKENIGVFLSDLVNMKYNKLSDFVKEYLRMTNDNDNDNKSIRTKENQFSQILKGKKGIQTYMLVPFSRLLGVSCESILTAGKSDARETGYHLSNYDIAVSDDERTWKYQFEHNKHAFLHLDEYGNTIFDYALENKNYTLIQFMKENELFEINENELRYNWLTEDNDPDEIIEIIDKFGDYNNSAAYYHITENDYYRSQLTVMAVERNDIEMLELIKARETRKIGNFGLRHYNDDGQLMLESEIMNIAFTDNDKIIDYFTGEYRKKNPFSWKNDDTCYSQLVYNYIGEVAERMIKYGRLKYCINVLRAIYDHNKCAKDAFQKRFDDSYDKAVEDGYYGDEPHFVSLLQNVLEISEDKKIISIQSSFEPLRLFTNVIRINADITKLEDEHVKSYLHKINEIHDFFSELRTRVRLKDKIYIVSGEEYRNCGSMKLGPFKLFSEEK